MPIYYVPDCKPQIIYIKLYKVNLLTAGGSRPISVCGRGEESGSTASSRRSSCSSLLECGSSDSEIVRRNLVTDFLTATSLPVNVPPHRTREAAVPPTPMKEEFGRCFKQIRFSLATKLFPAR